MGILRRDGWADRSDVQTMFMVQKSQEDVELVRLWPPTGKSGLPAGGWT